MPFDAFPICACGDEIDPRRVALGYHLCPVCGDREAKSVKFCVVNLHKSNYVMVTNPDELRGLNKYAS